MKSRTKARFVALQSLYELDLTDHLLGDVLTQRSEDFSLTPNEYDFALKLATGVMENSVKLDMLLSEHAPEWPLEQVAVIDRNILRIALWELAFIVKHRLK